MSKIIETGLILLSFFTAHAANELIILTEMEVYIKAMPKAAKKNIKNISIYVKQAEVLSFTTF